ncbi:DUF3854 domain-containing protein [Microcoleus sp. N9_B4]|uniref:DUF3854 domain-containing protein n=1 Tax=Microcoleus sp. N9_B4 TaxID=3055386 RepID=UPI002FD4D713
MSTDKFNATNVNLSSGLILPNPDEVCQDSESSKVAKPTQTYSPTFFLNTQHWESIATRGIFPKWAGANCMSSDIPKAKLMLGYEAYSAGIMLMSDCYGQWQFRPDNPWHSKGKEDKEPPKYRTPKGEYDLFLAKHPEIEAFWEDLDALKARCFTIDGKPYLLTTEGGFKAIMGCQYDIPTVAGVGVTMFLTPKAKGEPDLVPALKRVAEAGFNFIMAFDSDKKPETVKNVRYHETKLAKVLMGYGCDVRTVTGKWNHEDGKGMDDFIQNKGIEAFREILMKAESHSEPIVSGDKPPKSKKPPTPRQIAAEIAEEYGSQWKFDNEQKTWRIWTGKEWEKIEIGNFETLLQTVIDARNIEYAGDAFLTDVLKLLTKRLRVARWQTLDRKRYTNFNNCVLDGETFEILKHSPGMGFTSHLPYDYKPLAISDTTDPLETLKINCPSIYGWMRSAMQDSPKKMLKLLAVFAGALRFRFHDLQMFVHFVGKPGSGKGTAARLLQKVVGDANYAACKLDHLKDGSTVASIIDKQLVVFPDERKPTGIDSILSFTGGDAISYREVYRPASHAFFYGLMLICSNKPIFVGDTTGLERRLSLLHFDNPIATDKRDYSIEKSFDPEIASLIAIALTIPDATVTQLIRGTGENQIVEFKAKEWEMKYQSDSIAAFFNDELVLTEQGDEPVQTSNIYSSYRVFCELGGMKPLSVVKFPTMLKDLCTELGFSVEWKRTRGRSFFYGVRQRDNQVDDQPTYSETLAQMTGVEGVNDGGLTGVVRGLKPASVGSCGGFDQKMAKLSENLETPLNFSEKTEDLSEINSFDPPKPPSNAVTPNPQGIQPPSNPRQTPVIDSQPPSSETAAKKHKEFEVDNRVVITEHVHPNYKGAAGKILRKAYLTDRIHTRYQVELDKPVRGEQVVTVDVPMSDGLTYMMPAPKPKAVEPKKPVDESHIPF